MIGYTASVCTIKTRDMFVEADWGMLMSADYFDRHLSALSTGAFYAIDNGAWSAFKRNEPLNIDRFFRCLDVLHE